MPIWVVWLFYLNSNWRFLLHPKWLFLLSANIANPDLLARRLTMGVNGVVLQETVQAEQKFEQLDLWSGCGGNTGRTPC